MLQIDRKIFDLTHAHRGLGSSLLLHAVAAAALLSVNVPTANERPRRFTAIYLTHRASPVHRRPAIAAPKSVPAPKLSVMSAPARILQSVVPPRAEAPASLTPPSVAAPPPLLEAVILPEAPPLRPSAPPQRVETTTGLFESVATTAKSRPPGTKIETDSFDAPLSITAKSVRVLSSAGFGDAAPAPPARSEPRTRSSIGFEAVSTAPAVRRAGFRTGVSEPIEILTKPKPLYTEEARRLRIEGEVVLEVLFRASAQVCVLRVVKGLGHGLDASAESAALAIRFHPAEEAGRAVDSVATVKIAFQLAD